ncbi:MAG: hypothetical protein JXD22_14695 [Sedimentisphaerales bacterium]|nr:hypothetical protein [Sedimentisphaerales bacterium]
MKVKGLIDLQVNGFMGVDFSSDDLTSENFAQACRNIIATGVTAFLPTVITSHTDIYRQNLQIIAQVMHQPEFKGRLLGIHLEGPFISAQDGPRGAHQAQWTKMPDLAYLEQLMEWADGKVKLLTIAAELEGAHLLAQWAAQKQVAISLGHQLATEQDLDRLAQAGAKALTHLGNGVSAELPRHENPIWAGLANDNLTAMMITDGHHLPVSLIKSIIRVKGPHKCIVVSDSSPLAGMEPGKYETLGNKVLLEESGRLFIPDTGYLAGSSATMMQCMNYLASLKLVSTHELLMMGFENPLNLIALDAASVAQEQRLHFDENQARFYMKKDITS